LIGRPDPELFEALATLYQRQGKVTEAVDLLLGAVSERPKDETLLYILGAAYQRKGDHARSIDQMRAVLAVNPDNAAALNFIGYTLADQGTNFDEAEALLHRAIALKPDSGAFLDSLGWVYYRKGEFGRAVDMLEKAVSLSPDPQIIEHLGDAYHGTSNLNRAKDAYRRALDALHATPDPDPEEVKILRLGLERKIKLLSTETADR
jgi:tetratricopeptide (TPR) repeat protein